MGLRRLRTRLDQLQGSANLTLQDARDLLADFQDGLGISVQLDPNKFWDCWARLKSNEPFTLPLSIKIDPTVDTKGK